MPLSVNGITISDRNLKTGTVINPEYRKVRIVKPYPYTHRFRVKTHESGHSLIRLLQERFPFRSIDEWQKRIINGQIRVDGQHVPPEHLLQQHCEVTHFNPLVSEPAVPDEVALVDSTPDYLVVFKPSPMPVHPGGRYYKNTLISILNESGFGELKIIHRLDAVTSGLILFGRTKEFARVASEAFQNGTTLKKYYALVKGIPSEDEITIDLPVKRKNGFVFECVPKTSEEKHAITHFRILRRFEHHSLVACYPVTGRTHQIRLHLKAWGHPILNDEVYLDDQQNVKTLRQRHGIYLFNAMIKIPKLNLSYELAVPDCWFTGDCYLF